MDKERFYKTSETFIPGSKTLPQDYYVSPEIFAREKEIFFDGGWICAGHVSSIPEKGDYIVHNQGGESVIILRDQKGEVGGLHNVCRHRGTRICEAGGQFKNSIQCSYHAWTYDLHGSLIGAPFTGDISDFRKEDYSLKPAKLKVWDGFIFLNLGEKPTQFEKEFEPLIGRLNKWNMGELALFTTHSYEVASNWKYIFQNFNECYHCPTIHPLLNKFTDYVSGANDLTEGPFLGGSLDLKGESMTVSGRMCGVPLGELGGDFKRAYYYTISPNLLLNIHPDYVMYHLLTPRAYDKTLITTRWLFRTESIEGSYNLQEAVDFWEETNKQDWHVCELAQLGVQSRAYEPGPYSPRESLLAAFDRHYLKAMGS